MWERIKKLPVSPRQWVGKIWNPRSLQYESMVTVQMIEMVKKLC